MSLENIDILSAAEIQMDQFERDYGAVTDATGFLEGAEINLRFAKKKGLDTSEQEARLAKIKQSYLF